MVPENKTVDYQIASSTISRLRILAKRQKSGSDTRPWATFHGALKPHPFWGLPQWAFDVFPREQVPLPKHPEWINNEPELPYPEYLSCKSIDGRSELADNNLTILPYKPLPDSIVQKARQGYFAGVTHLDRMLGLVLDELEALGLENETIVSLHGDHGWCEVTCTYMRSRACPRTRHPLPQLTLRVVHLIQRLPRPDSIVGPSVPTMAISYHFVHFVVWYCAFACCSQLWARTPCSANSLPRSCRPVSPG